MAHVNGVNYHRMSEQGRADYELAKDPQPGTRIYRAHRGEDDDSVGMHWSTSRSVAQGIPNSGIHEAVIDDPEGQVVPWARLSAAQFQVGDTAPARSRTPRNVMGFDWENEVRLRPGAKIRLADGTERTVEHRGLPNYTNLSQYAVPGTPQHRQAVAEEMTGPLVQGSLFDEVSHEGKTLGYVQSLDTRSGDFSDALHSHMQDMDDLGERHGIDTERSLLTGNELEVKIPAQRDSTQRILHKR